MTVVTSLDEHKRYTHPQDQRFTEAVRNGNYQQLKLDDDTAFIEALELDNRDRQRFNVQTLKPRNPQLARLQWPAIVSIGVCLYALVIAALLHVIVAAR